MEAFNEFKQAFPSIDITSIDVSAFEHQFLPHALKILQKDVSIFDEDIQVLGVPISEFRDQESFWMHMQKCLLASFLTGDIKEKVGKIIEQVKSLWSKAGHSTDEIDKIIGGEESSGKITDLIEYLSNTRLAKILTSIVESLDISELGVDLEKPEEVVNLFKNLQGNPVVEKMMKKIQGAIEDKVKKGELTKEILVREVEEIKAKITSMFGDVVGEAMGLGRRDNQLSGQVLTSNSPEARRARMMARLQRKLNERRTSK
jgi:hypothetical protein